MMKRIYILTVFLVTAISFIQAEHTATVPDKVSSTCEWIRKLSGLPTHYCYCLEESHTFAFPLDTRITEPVWYTATLGDVKQGITAYLYADCEVKIDMYSLCSSDNAMYSYTLSPNQTRDINSDAIENKLASMGIENISDNTPVHLKIYPVGGTGGRVICMPYNQGFHSTCSDCLGIFPNMTVVSSHADDVFYLDADYIPADKGLAVYWDEPNNSLCRLKITRGVCDGAEVAEAELVSDNQPYYIDNGLLSEVRAMSEGLYLHFAHDASAVGRIRIKEYEKASTALSNISAESAAQILVDERGTMYIRKGNARYTILGNKL